MNLQYIIIPRVRLARNFHYSAIRNVCKTSSDIASIIRVDHAGELGADRIYAGQMAVLGNTKVGPLIQHMWDQEKVHKETFEKLITKHRVRPTAMVPIWNVAGFMLGAGTALMGEKAAMACTVAVESVIVDHYNDQLRHLMSEPEKNKDLLQTIQKFRDDEQEHHDCGIDHGAEQAVFYKGLTEVIKLGCRTAIAISKGLLSSGCQANFICNRCYSTSSTVPKQKWDLVSAVCVERKPKILRNFNEFEKRVDKTFAEIEFERSYKSKHEIRHEDDLARQKILSENIGKGTDVEAALVETALDFEDKCLEELKNFKPASRITRADEEGIVTSLRRKLDSHLTLVIEDKFGENALWCLPQGIRLEGETMRETAERVLKEKCGENLKVAFLGNAPWGFFKYKYPKEACNESYGAKVFFFKALHVSGQVSQSKKVSFQWSSRKELPVLLKNEKYLKNIEMFLIDEEET